MVRKFKTKSAIDTMHYKSVELVESVKKDVDEYQARIDEVLREMKEFFASATETSVYHENDDFRLICETMSGMIKHLSNAIEAVVDSKHIPYMRTDFSNMIKKHEVHGKIEEEQVSLILQDITKEFSNDIKNRIDKFLKSFQFTYQQVIDKNNIISRHFAEYNQLNYAIANKFTEEVTTLKKLLSLQKKLVLVLSKIMQDMEASHVALTKYTHIFIDDFLREIWKSSTGKIEKIARSLSKLWKKEISIPEDSSELEDHDFFRSTILDDDHQQDRKAKKKKTSGIEDMPMPDFTSQSKYDIELKIDFPYSNPAIANIVLNWIGGKYKSRNLMIQIIKIEKRYIFIKISSTKQETSKELKKYKEEFIHDFLSTTQIVVDRKQVNFTIRTNFESNYLRKIVPKLAPRNSNLRFVSFDNTTGNLCVEYINLREEVEKLQINDIKSLFHQYGL